MVNGTVSGLCFGTSRTPPHRQFLLEVLEACLFWGWLGKTTQLAGLAVPGRSLTSMESRAPSAGDRARCRRLPSLEPVRSAFGPVFGVYFVSLVAVLCFVQSKLSVSSWVKRQMFPSSKPQWNSPANAANEHKLSGCSYSSYACLSKYLSILTNTLWDDAYVDSTGKQTYIYFMSVPSGCFLLQ